MYIESVPNRNSPPAILLRESYRDGGKIKKRTIANLSSWPTDIIEGLRTLLKGGKVAAADQETIVVRRALPHGHVAAVLGTLRDIGLDRLLGPAGNRCRDLVIAMIVARLIAPASKLATARMLDPLTAAFSLGETLGLGAVDEDELYVALDWLGERQEAVEKALARKHLRAGMLVLSQIDKVKKRFALDHVVLVGDRGMITQARIDGEIAPAGLDWITALRAPAIRELAEAGALQMSLFDQRDMAAITSPDYPGERLIVCRNRDLARERARKREDLLAATEKDLAIIAAAVRRARKPLRGEAAIALKVGAVVNRHKMAKHFDLVIGEASFAFHRKAAAIAAEAALDGIYVVRTSLPKRTLGDAAAVGAYKSLAQVERAIPLLEDRRHPSASDLPLDDAARARPRLPVHARLSRRASHARQARPHALRRDRSRGRRRHAHEHRRQGRALRRRQAQANDRPHRRRIAGPQLPQPARRSRHLLPDPGDNRPQ